MERVERKYTILFICLFLLLLGIIGAVLFTQTIDLPDDTFAKDDVTLFFLPSAYDEFIQNITYYIQNEDDSIHCALRSLNHIEIENELLKAESRGTKVRIVVDNDYISNVRIHKPYVFFSRQNTSIGLMHHNFCIFGDDTIMTGSTIFNNNTITRTYHDSLIIQSKELAEAYSSEFWKLYLDQPRSKSNETTQTNVLTPKYSLLFCPDDTCIQTYVAHIDAANTSIRFGIYALTHEEIEDALLRAQKRGIQLQGYIESVGITNGSIAYRNVPGVQIHEGEYFLHTKLMIIDEEITITGTFNPSYTAASKNNENILIIKDISIAQYYTDLLKNIQRTQLLKETHTG